MLWCFSKKSNKSLKKSVDDYDEKPSISYSEKADFSWDKKATLQPSQPPLYFRITRSKGIISITRDEYKKHYNSYMKGSIKSNGVVHYASCHDGLYNSCKQGSGKAEQKQLLAIGLAKKMAVDKKTWNEYIDEDPSQRVFVIADTKLVYGDSYKAPNDQRSR